MKPEFPVEKTVRSRRSVRTFEKRPLSPQDKDGIFAYMEMLSNPFSIEIPFRYAQAAAAGTSEHLGTYGVIKGATEFIGAAVTDGELVLESLGYSFERLILYATSLGIGTCWLGGTFHRSRFAEAMGAQQGQILPVISPIGYPSGQKRLVDSMLRSVAGSDRRRGWDELFFHNTFSHPLTRENAGDYAFALEMLRLAPSASNHQPWRVVKAGNAFHFYEAKTSRAAALGFDMQRIDLGIAACHFHLSALELGLPGKFDRLDTAAIPKTDNAQYVFSWTV